MMSRVWQCVCVCMPVFLYKLAWLTNCLAMLMKIGIAHSFPYAPHLGGYGAKLRADISQALKKNAMGLAHAGRRLGGALSCGGWMARLWDTLGSYFGSLWSKQLTACGVILHNIIQCDFKFFTVLFCGLHGRVIRKLQSRRKHKLRQRLKESSMFLPLNYNHCYSVLIWFCFSILPWV